MGKSNEGRNRVVIENVQPELSCGRFPIKRIVGESVEVEADVFSDGHDEVEARLLWKREGESLWQVVPMAFLGNDRWRAKFPVEEVGRYTYTVAGAIDSFGTWRHDFDKRKAAGQDLTLAIESGALLLEQIASWANGADAAKLLKWAQELRSQSREVHSPAIAAELALADDLAELASRYPDQALETRYRHELTVVVDRERAGFSAWYEVFPRSWSPQPGEHGTLRDLASQLQYVAEMGFDVLYLPPIHPIGRSFRKGKNNRIEAAPGDVGSPWAIGAKEGGHTAIHPSLGTLEDFAFLLKRANQFGLEIALDIAFQCSPDHPWVTDHPEFFKKRPDGSIQYAENPPKKYQDIYPLDFESTNWKVLWDALKGVFDFWIAQGVRLFRVDNPHTKAFPFWGWLISEIKAEAPDVLFLAEAFTRPRVMEQLAKLGFSQSYTYFTWRNTKEEITEYMLELTQTPLREYFRPNFWPNTPDILTEALQVGGPAAFKSRLVLAATLSSNYGVYGPAYELGEHLPLRQGSEEYLNSEKYEIRTWNLKSPETLAPLMAKLNRARRENRALQSNLSLRFHATDNPMLICYSKRERTDNPGTEDNTILVTVNLDPYYQQSGWVNLDLEVLGLGSGEAFEVEDLLADQRFLWRGARNYVEHRPHETPAHVFRIRKHMRTEKDFDYYR